MRQYAAIIERRSLAFSGLPATFSKNECVIMRARTYLYVAQNLRGRAYIGLDR